MLVFKAGGGITTEPERECENVREREREKSYVYHTYIKIYVSL